LIHILTKNSNYLIIPFAIEASIGGNHARLTEFATFLIGRKRKGHD